MYGAQTFAAFIDELSIYGRGEALSQFDQVFNGQGDYRQPMLLDDGEFSVLPVQGDSELTVTQLCSALGIDLQTYRYLAMAIAGAHVVTDNKLKRTPAVISSFYRLVKLPRLLGMTPVEGVLMLTLLGGEDWLYGLAGAPLIYSTRVDTPDVLDLDLCPAFLCGVRKAQTARLRCFWMLQHISQPQALTSDSDDERQLFEKVRSLLPGAQFTLSALLMAGKVCRRWRAPVGWICW